MLSTPCVWYLDRGREILFRFFGFLYLTLFLLAFWYREQKGNKALQLRIALKSYWCNTLSSRSFLNNNSNNNNRIHGWQIFHIRNIESTDSHACGLCGLAYMALLAW